MTCCETILIRVGSFARQSWDRIKSGFNVEIATRLDIQTSFYRQQYITNKRNIFNKFENKIEKYRS